MCAKPQPSSPKRPRTQAGVHFRDVISPSLEPLVADKLPAEIDHKG